MKNIARNKFRANRELHSTRLLKLGFHAGYEVRVPLGTYPRTWTEQKICHQALDLLDVSASGDTTATAKLDTLLSKTSAGLTRLSKKPATKPRNPISDHLPPEAKTLVVRPRPTVSGIRQIPKLVNAGGVPILRFKKPQPPGLSRLIRDKIQQRQDMFDRINNLRDIWIPLGEAEDRWDSILEERFGVTDTRSQSSSREEPRWSDVMKETVEQSFEWYDEQKEKASRTAARMQHIVEQETELAMKEKYARIGQRREERMATAALKQECPASECVSHIK